LVKLSIIIPFSQNEKDISLLFNLKKKFKNFEIIFVGSNKNIFVKKKKNLIRKISKVYFLRNTSRALCLNFGANLARNKILWFLHLDSKIHEIPKNFYKELNFDQINCFKLKFDNKKLLINSICANLRSKILKNPFGDQSYIMSKNIFFYINRFNEELKEGEDHEFIIRSYCKGIKINILKYYLISSARKYDDKGNILITIIFFYKSIVQIIFYYFKNLKFLSKKAVIIVFMKYPFSKNSKKRIRAKISNIIVDKFNEKMIKRLLFFFENKKYFNFVIGLKYSDHKIKSLKYFYKFPKILLEDENLGIAMKKAYIFFKNIFKKIIFVGSDIPDLTVSHMNMAIKTLNYYDNYFIKTNDGGFCLFGTKQKNIEKIFTKVNYSRKNTFKNFSKFTKKNYIYQKTLDDIDTSEQLKNFLNKKFLKW